jgi:hypothetical protein
MNCLRALELRDYGFESHSKQYLRAFILCLCCSMCVGRGLASGRYPIPRVLQTAYNIKKVTKAAKSRKWTVQPLPLMIMIMIMIMIIIIINLHIKYD